MRISVWFCTALFAGLLAGCGGGSAPGTSSGTAGGSTAAVVPQAALLINGQPATTTTNTISSADGLSITASGPVHWSFIALNSAGEPDTTTTQDTTLDGLATAQPNPDTQIPDSSVTGTSTFNVTAPPGDFVVLTLSDPSTGATLATYTFDVVSPYAGNWTISYSVTTNNSAAPVDSGTCPATVTTLGVLAATCTSSSAGTTFTLNGQPSGLASFAFTTSNGSSWTFLSGSPTSMNGSIGTGGGFEGGAWTATKG